MGDAPFAVAAFEPVDIPPTVQRDGRTRPVLPDHHEVGLGVGHVAVDLTGVVGDVVLLAVMARPVAGERPGDELLDRAAEDAVVVDRAGVVRGAQQVLVEPVDAAGVAQQRVVDLLAVEQLLEAAGVGCSVACVGRGHVDDVNHVVVVIQWLTAAIVAG